jgi:branched-chain amino acid transport system substrate-binding protein
MARRIKVLLLLCAALLQTAAAEPTPIKVGVVTPLTGPQAAWGNDTLDILRFLNAKYGQGKIDLIVEDDKCDSKEAAAIAHKFAAVNRIKYVIGPLCSGAALAAAPILDRAGVLTIATLPGAPSFSEAGDNIFRTRPSDIGAAELLAEYISKTHKNVGVVAEQTDYAQGMKEQFKKFAERNDLKVFEVDFLAGTADFRPLLLTMRQKSVESLLMIPQTEGTAALIAKQRRELKLEAPLYGSLVPGSRTFRDMAGEAAEGIIFAVIPSPADAGPEASELYKEYIDQYGPLRSVEYVFACTYNAYEGMRSALFSGQNPKEHLYSTKFKGLGGDFWFDRSGDIQGLSFTLKQYRNLEARALSR